MKQLQISVILLLLASQFFGCAEGEEEGLSVIDYACGNGVLEPGEICDDGNDLQNDGCSSSCVLDEICDDGLDNDGDGTSDCDDAGCDSSRACTDIEEDCETEGDEDGNGLSDCEDPACEMAPQCLEEDCSTEGDEDGNGLSDCEDPACVDAPECAVTEEDCDLVGDEDGNGLADCEDPACESHPDCIIPVEDCESEGDEDGNGLADCEDPACIDEEVCQTVCGDGVVEEDELCDDGELNSDSDPNACRSDCTLPICGDGVVDDDEIYGEYCDQGELNNDRGVNTCREDCSWPYCGDEVIDNENPDPDALVPHEECDGDTNCDESCRVIDVGLACGETITVHPLNDHPFYGDDGEVLQDTYLVKDRILGLESMIEPVFGCIDESEGGAVTTGGEHVYVFSPTEDGQFVARTDLPGTVIDTLLVVRTICDSPAGEICEDNAWNSFGSSLHFTGEAGRNYYIIVDTLFGELGDYELTVQPVVFAETGALCGEGVYCLDGVCANVDGEAICISDSRPFQESFEIFLLSSTPDITCGFDSAGLPINLMELDIRSTGIDEDRDIETMHHILRSESGGEFFFINPVNYVTVYDDEGYDARASLTLCDLTASDDPIIYFSGGVEDLAGNTSELIEVNLEALVASAAALEGDPCDPLGLASLCEEGSFCQAQEDGGFLCSRNSTAPVLSGLDAIRLDTNTVRVLASGSDSEGDAAGLALRLVDITGTIDLTEQLVGVPLWELNFSHSTDGAVDWSGQVQIYATPSIEMLTVDVDGVSVSVGGVYVQVFDDIGNRSEEELFVEVPQWVVADYEEPCDPLDTGVYCPPEMICDPDSFGGGVCLYPEFEVTSFNLVWAADISEVYPEAGLPPVPAYAFEVEVQTNATADVFDSVAVLRFEAYSGSEYIGAWEWTDVDDEWYGANTVSEIFFGAATNPPEFTHMDAVALNYYDERSPIVRGGVVPIRIESSTCDPDYVINICELGNTCDGDSALCLPATPPTAMSATPLSTTLNNIAFEVSGEDVDGDVVGFFMTFQQEDGIPVVGIRPDILITVDPPGVFGQTTFSGINSAYGSVFLDPAVFTTEELLQIYQLDLSLYDASGLWSEPILFSLRPGAGDVCSTAADGMPCETGLYCDDSGGTAVCRPL